MNPYEFNDMLDRLRKGEKVKCPNCKNGILEPVGKVLSTKGFKCKECGQKLNLN